ncbi:MAG: histidinol dehydrogenase [Bacteroidaceae bacterium]|nr:histidinol dehydrogenase [Bacteroidaceae bacterium]
MYTAKYPTEAELQRLLERPAFDVSQLFDTVGGIMDEVRRGGDTVLRQLELRFDKANLDQLSVSPGEMDEAGKLLPDILKEALHQAYGNIRAFHEAQRFREIEVETCAGVICRQKAVPINRVGLYIPGGSAPLFSTVLMLAAPAQIAGCREVVLCTPPSADGRVNPAILYAASLCGVNKIFKVGGAQAIAAMTFGTESLPRVDKIFGPGNQYVMAAKQLATLHGVSIDMPAGPSEVAVIADEKAHPAFVAADLLSQAEHGPDSQVILLSNSHALMEQVQQEVERQLEALPRREIAAKALKHSVAIITHDLDEAISISNRYAPEHLILAVEDYRGLADKVTCAGSVFEGKWSCESAGDYASGTNHTLPTKGYARSYGGLSLDSFVRKMTFQELSPAGIRTIGNTVVEMANREGLYAHGMAMQLRIDEVNSNTK